MRSRWRIGSLVLAGLLACTAKPEAKDPPQIITAVPVRELASNDPSASDESTTGSIGDPRIEPVACVASPRPKGTLEFVRQQRASLPDRFDPSGRFVASELGCGVWTLEPTIFLGDFGSPRESGDCVAWPGPGPGEDPCATWPELVELGLDPIGPLQTTISADPLELVIDKKQVRARSGASERYRFESAGQAYVAASRSPDQTLLALARPDAIELRSLESGALLAELSLERPQPRGGELWQLALTWSNAMPVALIGREPACAPDVPEDDCEWSDWYEDESVWELRRWANPDAEARAELVTWEDGTSPAWIREAHADPLGRWLWVWIDWGPSHDSPWEYRQIPLHAAAEKLTADFSERGIDGEREFGLNDWGITDHAELSGSWSAGARTARVWSITDSDYDGEGSGSDDLWWASWQLWPRPVRSGPHELASDYSVGQQTLEVLGVADDQGLVAWSHCWPTQDLDWLINDQGLTDVGEDRCRGADPRPAGCEARGVSDRLDWLLVECGSSWRLLPIGPAAAVLEPVELAGVEHGSVTAVVGRSGLALAGSTSGLRLFGPDGQLRASFAAVTSLIPATLGPELDRAVGRSPAGLEVFNLATARREALVTLPPDAAITHLAFAPDGRRLAVSDDRSIAVHELDTGTSTRWDAGTVLGLAWRQDGAALLSGAERELPERAWDPATGKLLPVQPDPRFLDRLADADLDPSWRWAFEGDDVILRTLDGLALYLEPKGWVVTASGLYDGVGAAPPLFVRIIGDARPRVLDLESLPKRLRHPDLLEHFIAGVALPPPRLDPTELAALR